MTPNEEKALELDINATQTQVQSTKLGIGRADFGAKSQLAR